MKKLIQRSILFLILTIGLIWFWDSYRSSTFEAAIIQSISKNEMKVTNLNGRQRTIAVSLDLTKILEVNKKYIIYYDKRILDKPRLRANACLRMYKNDCLRIDINSNLLSEGFTWSGEHDSLSRASQPLIQLASWLVSHARRGSMSSFHDVALKQL